MIKKPANYDNYSSEFESLNLGGHKCIIKDVKEQRNQFGNMEFRVFYDTAEEDVQPKFFSNKYLSDARENKNWPYNGSISWLIGNEWWEKNLNGFTHAVAESNPDAKIWGADDILDLAALKGLKIGVVFGREEKSDPELRVYIKPRYVCSFDKAPDQKIPAVKVKGNAAPAATDYGFVNVAEDDDEGLPFK